MNVVKNKFLPLNFNRDRLVPPVQRNILPKPIMVNIAKWFFCRPCKQTDLFARAVLSNQELPNCRCTLNTFKKLESTGDRCNLLS